MGKLRNQREEKQKTSPAQKVEDGELEPSRCRPGAQTASNPFLKKKKKKKIQGKPSLWINVSTCVGWKVRVGVRLQVTFKHSKIAKTKASQNAKQFVLNWRCFLSSQHLM